MGLFSRTPRLRHSRNRLARQKHTASDPRDPLRQRDIFLLRLSLRASRSSILAWGVFWGAERRFWEQEGVYTTAVGYAGGFTENPTYDEVCSGLTAHSENGAGCVRP